MSPGGQSVHASAARRGAPGRCRDCRAAGQMSRGASSPCVQFPLSPSLPRSLLILMRLSCICALHPLLRPNPSVHLSTSTAHCTTSQPISERPLKPWDCGCIDFDQRIGVSSKQGRARTTPPLPPLPARIHRCSQDGGSKAICAPLGSLSNIRRKAEQPAFLPRAVYPRRGIRQEQRFCEGTECCLGPGPTVSFQKFMFRRGVRI